MGAVGRFPRASAQNNGPGIPLTRGITTALGDAPFVPLLADLAENPASIKQGRFSRDLNDSDPIGPVMETIDGGDDGR
jgi:hypothetical protein